MGMKVVAVSDVNGGVTGFNSVTELHKYAVENGTVVGAPGTEKITNTELLHLPVDVLVPAALADAINESTASGIRARIVVEGANAPITDCP